MRNPETLPGLRRFADHFRRLMAEGHGKRAKSADAGKPARRPWTVEDLNKESGISEKTIKNWRSAKAVPRSDNIYSMCLVMFGTGWKENENANELIQLA